MLDNCVKPYSDNDIKSSNIWIKWALSKRILALVFFRCVWISKQVIDLKAIMKIAPGAGNVEIRDIPEPTPGVGQVMIKVDTAGLCGTDLHILKDEFRSWPPVVLGHEIAGEIEALGEGITSLTPGDKVT